MAQKDKTKKKPTGQICITFDELPVASTFTETDANYVTSNLLSALKNHKAPAAGFVVGSRIDGSYDLLGAWLNDGHLLGSLTNSHQDLHQLGWEPFIQDLSNGHNALEPMLSGFGQKQRFFRYPFLHYGNDVESKREVNRYLAANDIFVAHATIVVEDYLYNLSLEKLGKEIDSADYLSIRDEYLEHVLDQVIQAEEQAKEVLKRSCRHILLLRANRLNAEFLGDLLTMLEERGYQFISLDKALDDELYSAPEAYFGARGVGYIEMIRNSDTDLLPAE
jgi:peptidoglycan/xylan/chitin deacetylase (PgdA/CDA1 family)